jgi:hypothetical protein
MSQKESAAVLETFWSNVYLRGTMFFDPVGDVAQTAYAQPDTGLPGSRAAVIAPDQTIALSHFGHHPQRIIDTILALLAGMDDPLRLQVDQTPAGTLVQWNDLPQAASYDVIRGSLENVAPAGPLIGLGPVVCIEASSPDESTAGDEDGAVPDPGGAFFYLVQHDHGAGQVYGAASSGRLRKPGSGDCD